VAETRFTGLIVGCGMDVDQFDIISECLEAVSEAYKGRATACVIGGGVLAALIAPTLGHMARDLASVPFAGTYLLIASLAASGRAG